MQYRICNIEELTWEQYQAAHAMMSPDRQRRVMRYSHKSDLQRSIAADYLARRMAAERFGIEPEDVVIENLESGQPVLVGLDCHISLSHSDCWVLCALSDSPVGADIEAVRKRGKHLTHRICTAEEQAYILASGEVDEVRFYEVWTAKEAFLKRTGVGLSGGLKTTVVADASGLLRENYGCTLLCGRHENAVFSIAY